MNVKSENIYPLVLDDGGRNLSIRPMQTNDCTVRCLSIITKISYDEIYDILANEGREPCQGFDIDCFFRKKKHIKLLNGQLKKLRIKNDTTAFDFIKNNRRGKYILGTYNHVWAVINGVSHDLWRISEKYTLTDAWKFEKLSK